MSPRATVHDGPFLGVAPAHFRLDLMAQPLGDPSHKGEEPDLLRTRQDRACQTCFAGEFLRCFCIFATSRF